MISGRRSCISEPRLIAVSLFNLVWIFVNIISFLLNLFQVTKYKHEKKLSTVSAILFLLSSIIVMWFLVTTGPSPLLSYAAATLFVTCLLYAWDIKILPDDEE